jgi:hypothetical protein
MINTCKNDARQHYVPMGKLTYSTRLKQMLKEELGYQGKPKVLDLLVDEIETITRECFVSNQEVGLGQIRVLVPSIDDRPSWGQKIEDTKLVTVTLTLFASEDADWYKDNEKSGIIMQKKLARIAKEAVNQKGVLSTAVAACILGVKQTTVSNHARKYFERTGKIIPLRGYVHDIGRTTTHKRWIVELYLYGYTTKEIQERTEHKICSIDRYLKRYLAVEQIMKELKTVDPVKISKLLDISVNSAKEYSAIYLEYTATGNIQRLDYYSDINKKTEEQLAETKSDS